MTMNTKLTGRVTIPTDTDVVPETIELLNKWGADAIRDCDGTDYPEELKCVQAKVYKTFSGSSILSSPVERRYFLVASFLLFYQCFQWFETILYFQLMLAFTFKLYRLISSHIGSCQIN
nr:1,3-beta-galactosyl-N-acetylhexosamine phosphorylase N-terminal domain-containing protein [Anaerocolumna sp.]